MFGKLLEIVEHRCQQQVINKYVYEQLFITDEETIYRTSSHTHTRARAREGFGSSTEWRGRFANLLAQRVDRAAARRPLSR
jgi:hypothetical protein